MSARGPDYRALGRSSVTGWRVAAIPWTKALPTNRTQPGLADSVDNDKTGSFLRSNNLSKSAG